MTTFEILVYVLQIVCFMILIAINIYDMVNLKKVRDKSAFEKLLLIGTFVVAVLFLIVDLFQWIVVQKNFFEVMDFGRLIIILLIYNIYMVFVKDLLKGKHAEEVTQETVKDLPTDGINEGLEEKNENEETEESNIE